MVCKRKKFTRDKQFMKRKELEIKRTRAKITKHSY